MYNTKTIVYMYMYLRFYLISPVKHVMYLLIHPASQCDKKAALDVYHQQVFNPPTKIGILGSGCSVSTEPTALISHYYNLNQVMYMYIYMYVCVLLHVYRIGHTYTCMYMYVHNYSLGVIMNSLAQF